MKVIIVEDEILAQQELTWLINTHSQMEIVGSFDDGLDVLKFLQHNKVDAIFLDINIPSLDGVLLAQNISQFDVGARPTRMNLSSRSRKMMWSPMTWPLGVTGTKCLARFSPKFAKELMP